MSERASTKGRDDELASASYPQEHSAVEIVARALLHEEYGCTPEVVPNEHQSALWRAKVAIAAYEASLAGTVRVPVEPTPELLRSMAIRYDHGLGVEGYYDQPIFGAENVGHAKRLEATIRTMRQLHEEVVGTGFYRPPSALENPAVALADATPSNPLSEGRERS